jgi:hypothetical protein
MALSIVSGVSVQANSPSRFLGTEKVRTHLISQAFNVPDRGAPPVTSGGATRGGCEQKEQRLISLMPKQKLGLTYKERPTFFWHKSQKNLQTAEFLLLDDKDNLIYETELTLPEKQGIFAFTLPSEAPGLKVNNRYHWFLSVNCSSEETDDIVTIEGWVERSKPNLAVQLKLNKLEPKELSTIYADAGIWHDAITYLAEKRCIAPNDSNVLLYWKQLLTSVGLSDVISEPLNSSCTVEK